MVIHRITGQKRKTFLEFYTPYDGQFDSAHIALDAMRELLQRLFTLDGRELFAFTSHYRLNFLHTDTHTGHVIARIIPGCTPDSNGPMSALFHIGYPPSVDAQRDGSDWVFKTATTVDDAVRDLLLAFRESAFSPYSE